ncbi:MAG: DUF58 domain-containing protein [Flavobacteriaceae bacterium]|nr:DUF58 domain-containing protein [Flavobacteriaceae bacterium]
MNLDIKDIIKKVKQIEIRSRKKTDAQLMGQYHSVFKGQGMSFAEVRKYQFGDEIRRIDWNKTARFQEPFIKEMEEERELTMMLLVDISSSMNYGTKTQLKREFVAEICASLGFSAVGNNDKVGMVLFADKVYKIIPPQKGKKHILAMISQILSANYIPAKTNIDEALKSVMNIFKRKSLLFLFSDFNDKIDEKTLKIASQKHELLGIRIYDDKDHEIPDVGYAEFQDIETGQSIVVNTSNARFRYEFAEIQRQKLKDIQEFFSRSSTGFLNLNTGENYIKELHQYFNRKKN